jgi:hypothetical protein
MGAIRRSESWIVIRITCVIRKHRKEELLKMKTIKAFTTFSLAIILAGMLSAAKAAPTAVTIPQQVLTYQPGHYLAGQLIPLGFDVYGYNYQAHMFRGYYANAFLGADGLPPYYGDTAAYLAANPSAATKDYWADRDVWLEMKWNDAWLSNKDSDGDGVLDRHFGFPGYPGSGAWLTNHLWGNNDDGSQWNNFAKFVAVPLSAFKVGGVWYDASGQEIGPEIWDNFAIVLEIINNPATDQHGKHFVSPVGPGLGEY